MQGCSYHYTWKLLYTGPCIPNNSLPFAWSLIFTIWYSNDRHSRWWGIMYRNGLLPPGHHLHRLLQKKYKIWSSNDSAYAHHCTLWCGTVKYHVSKEPAANIFRAEKLKWRQGAPLKCLEPICYTKRVTSIWLWSEYVEFHTHMIFSNSILKWTYVTFERI